MNLLIPSPELLLKAALLRGELSLAAWREWVEFNDLELAPIDPGSYMLLPLIYSNLTCGGSDEGKLQGDASWMPSAREEDGEGKQIGDENKSRALVRLRGIYRHTWADNETGFRLLGCALKLLADAGIPTLLPDGAALALRFYRSHACRPVRIQTVWVRVDQVLEAARRLRKAGWQAVTRLPASLAAMRNRVRRAWPLRDEIGHLVFLRGRSWSDRERAMWAASKPLQVGAGHGLALNPTEQFLYLSAQASRARSGPAPSFLADAAQLLRTSGAVMDWSGIQRQATARALIRQVSMISEELKEISLKGDVKKSGKPLD